MMARLNRTYIFESPVDNAPLELDYQIKIDLVHLDHHLTLCTIILKEVSNRPLSYKMNLFYLKDQAVRNAVGRIWRSHSNLEFFGKL